MILRANERCEIFDIDANDLEAKMNELSSQKYDIREILPCTTFAPISVGFGTKVNLPSRYYFKVIAVKKED